MKYFDSKGFQKGYRDFSFFLSKFQYSKGLHFDRPFFVEVSGHPAARSAFDLVSLGKTFAFTEAQEIITQLILISEKINTDRKRLEMLLKKYDPYCRMILVGNSSLRKTFHNVSRCDGRSLFTGREIVFIEHLGLDGKLLAFDPSSFVIDRKTEEKDASMKKTMQLNCVDQSKKSLFLTVRIKN